MHAHVEPRMVHLYPARTEAFGAAVRGPATSAFATDPRGASAPTG